MKLKLNSLYKYSISVFSILLLSILLILPSSSFAAKEFSVGVSPPVVDVGEVERDSSEIVSFYIVTVSEEELLVQLENAKGNLDFFNRPGYKNMVFNYSEEDASGWAEFLKNPVELKPTGETIETPGGGTIRGWREVSFILNVPENAEAGYHTLTIAPFPVVTTEVEGRIGVAIRAVTAITILFNVPGTAIREGTILDVSSGDYVGDRLEINTFFQNIGTVMVSARPSPVKIYDKYGRLLETLSSSMAYIKPGETKVLKSYLDVDGLDLGEYDVSVNVSYGTGYASKESTIVVYEKPPTVELQPPEKPYYFPLWLLIIPMIVIIAYLIYRRG